MMKGGHLDHYYYELVENVRRYKSVPALRPATPAEDDSVGGWLLRVARCRSGLSGHAGETAPRDFDGVGGRHDTDRSGLNDFNVMKVAGWEGYSFVVNRGAPGVLERSRGGWNWEHIADVPMLVRGNELYFAIRARRWVRRTARSPSISSGWMGSRSTPIR